MFGFIANRNDSLERVWEFGVPLWEGLLDEFERIIESVEPFLACPIPKRERVS